MSAFLTTLTALLGAGLVGVGWRGWFRARFRMPDARLSRSARRRAWTLIGVGGVLALLPELTSAVLGILPDRSALVLLLLALYRVLVAIGLVAVVGTITLAHERVTTPVGRFVGDTRETVLRTLPVGPGRRARTLRRQLGVDAFPAGWDEVVALDHALATRLLAYERDEHASANRPAMRDFADPVTADAYAAMLAADGLRGSQRARRGSDALETDYGRAVARFQVAFDTAEAHAATLATGRLGAAERDAIARAERTLKFLRTNSASAGEREQAYADLAASLDAARGESADVDDVTRAHPWLDVTERATR